MVPKIYRDLSTFGFLSNFCNFWQLMGNFSDFDQSMNNLLNRSPVPAMDLKSNGSGLWRHILETCRRLRRLCRKNLSNVARHDKTQVKSTLLSRDRNILSCGTNFMSRRSYIMLCFYTLEVAMHALSVCLILQCCHIRHNFWCRLVYYKTLILWNSLIILFWNHTNDVTSLVKVHREYLPAARILHTKFD